MAWDNTAPPKQPNALERMFDISSRAGCERAMRNGAIVLLVSSVLIGFLGYMAFWGTPFGDARLDDRLASMRDPFTLVTAAVYGVLGLYVYRRSRAAATLALIYAIALVILESLEIGRISVNIFRFFILAMLVTATVASYRWHRLYAAEAAQGVQLPQSTTGYGKGLPVTPDSAFMGTLRFIYVLLAIFAGVMTVGSVPALVEEPGLKSVMGILQTALMLFAAISAYGALKISATKAVKFAVLLFAVGFFGMAAFRMSFIPGGKGATVFEFLLFGFPAALVLFRAWQESRSAPIG